MSSKRSTPTGAASIDRTVFFEEEDGPARLHSGQISKKSGASRKRQQSERVGPKPSTRSARSGFSKGDDEAAACIDKGPVSAFFGCVVLVHGLFVGLDVQVRASGGGKMMSVLASFEAVFLSIFVSELVLRMCADGCPNFFYSGWNMLDTLLVLVSTVDVLAQFVLSNDEAAAANDVGKFRAIRLLKITSGARLVRFFRVFRFRAVSRSLRGLVLVVQAVIAAMKSLAWFILLFAVTTYLFAIVTTEFVGLWNEEEDPVLDEWFGDLFKSAFTLVQMSTLENWAEIARYVGEKLGGQWFAIFLCYVLATNMVLLNVALATLIEKLLSLKTDLRGAKAGEEAGEIESWMLTPSSSGAEDWEDDVEEEKSPVAGHVGAPSAWQGAMNGLAVSTLIELFDQVSAAVGEAGVNQRKLVTERSFKNALVRPDVQEKLFQVCPGMKAADSGQLATQILAACPKRFDREGLLKQEFVEACLALKGELSMNHFVSISVSLQQLEKHVNHELTHLNEHQRKLNRRFLKLRHRLRKVYHFDGSPRKLAEMANELQRRAPVAERSSVAPKRRSPRRSNSVGKIDAKVLAKAVESRHGSKEPASTSDDKSFSSSGSDW